MEIEKINNKFKDKKIGEGTSKIVYSLNKDYVAKIDKDIFFNYCTRNILDGLKIGTGILENIDEIKNYNLFYKILENKNVTIVETKIGIKGIYNIQKIYIN